MGGSPLLLFGAPETFEVYRDIPEALKKLVEPIIEQHGFELVDLVRREGPPPWLLRVWVDTPAGDGRVPVEACAALSREIGARLEAENPLPAPFDLEVSSPGLDRVLARDKDFAAACGGEVRVETRAPIAGRRRFRGTLAAVAEGQLRIAVDGGEFEIPIAQVARARSVYRFSREDFATGAKRRRHPGSTGSTGSNQ